MKESYRNKKKDTRYTVTHALVMNIHKTTSAKERRTMMEKLTKCFSNSNLKIPCAGTLSSWVSKLLYGKPPDWMMERIQASLFLLRRYNENRAR